MPCLRVLVQMTLLSILIFSIRSSQGRWRIHLGVPRSPWQYNKVETSVYQKVKVLLEFREIDVALRNVVQAQGLRKIGRQIIQLFLDSHDRAKMSEDVRKYVQTSTSRRSSRSRRKPHRQTNALTIILIKTAGFWISQRPNFSIFRR
ncbi:hypothetical protein F5882DRAFT_411329 [Hyaloscypha sp. PMI_1271]|nr:hypothetical protein F5882DRAFT_411329 [Hyaloscypha sp. PMI_1271]